MAKIRHFVPIQGKQQRDRLQQDIEKQINGGIAFGVPSTVLFRGGFHTIAQRCDNIDGVLIKVPNSGTANTEFTIVHNLGRIPVGFDVKRINSASTVFDSGTAWTKTKMFLKCSGGNAIITLFVF